MSKRQRPSSRRLSQQPDKNEDAFVASVMELSTWTGRNHHLLIMGGVVLALAVVGGVYYVDFQRTLTVQAVNRLESIHQTISISALEDAKAQLSVFVDRFEGTEQADEAIVLLGRLHLEGGDAAVAISVLERAQLGFRQSIALQGNTLLARAYEDLGRWADAEGIYLRVADGAELDFQIRASLAGAARVRRRQQDLGGAAELYERILATFEDGDPAKGIYELRLAEVREIVS